MEKTHILLTLLARVDETFIVEIKDYAMSAKASEDGQQ